MIHLVFCEPDPYKYLLLWPSARSKEWITSLTISRKPGTTQIHVPYVFLQAKKIPGLFRERGFFLRLDAWQWPTLTWGDPTLPSALSTFTSEFEMGSGGSHSLWSSGNSFAIDALWGASRLCFTILMNECCLICWYLYKQSVCLAKSVIDQIITFAKACDYMVKPHEQLVLVSSTPRGAYTPSLSTS